MQEIRKCFGKLLNIFLLKNITLIEEYKIIGNDSDTACILNTFFINIVSDLKIPEYNKCDALSEIAIKIATTKIAIQLINFDKIQVGRFIALTAKWHLGNLHLKVEITYIGEVP